MKQSTKNQRIKYTALFLLFTVTEVCIALYVHDDFIRSYAGDALVTAAVYCFIRIFIPNGVPLMPLYVFLFAAAVEVSQYFKLAEILRLENSRFFSVLLGATFDIKDILCYGAGCIVIWLAERDKNG